MRRSVASLLLALRDRQSAVGAVARYIRTDDTVLTTLLFGDSYFFYHEGHPSTAVHRVVGKKLFEEIAARPPAAR